MTPNPIEHENIKINLKHDNILRENICVCKMNFYLSQFDKFKNDLSKTWSAINNLSI